MLGMNNRFPNRVLLKYENATQNLPIAAVLLCTNVKNETELLRHFSTVVRISVPLKRRLLCRVKERIISPPPQVCDVWSAPNTEKARSHIRSLYLQKTFESLNIDVEEKLQ